jgi:hypothetical protein
VPCNRPEGPEGGRGIALLFLDLGARRCGWSAPRPGRFTPRKDLVPIVQEAGWAPGPVWSCAKNLAPIGIRSSDRPACSQPLYRLSYPGPYYNLKTYYILKRLRLHSCHCHRRVNCLYYTCTDACASTKFIYTYYLLHKTFQCQYFSHILN